MARKSNKRCRHRKPKKRIRSKKKLSLEGQHAIDFSVKYRDIKFPRLEFRTGILELITSPEYDPDGILQKHIEWIKKKQELIERCLREAKKLKISKRTDRQFKSLVFAAAKKVTYSSNTDLNRIFFRKMRTKWASYSSKRNLTVNTLMRYLPKRHITYILYHEFMHMHEKRHNDRFWRLVARKFKNYKEFERSLFSYWFLVNRQVH